MKHQIEAAYIGIESQNPARVGRYLEEVVGLMPGAPTPDGARRPTVPETLGRDGRLACQDAGIRTTTPALSSSGTAPRNRAASGGPQRSG